MKANSSTEITTRNDIARDILAGFAAVTPTLAGIYRLIDTGQLEVVHVGRSVRVPAAAIDDLVDSGGTLCNAAVALMARGASSASVYVTHGVLSGGAVDRIATSCIESLTMTDSIQATDAARAAGNIRQFTIAPILAEAMQRISDESSVSSLFD